MKRLATLLLLGVLVMALAACSTAAAATVEDNTASGASTGPVQVTATAPYSQQAGGTTSSPVAVEYDQDDLEVMKGTYGLSYVRLQGDSITFEGSGAVVDGTILMITSAGNYSISGTLSDGQIVVDTQDEETVSLVLDGADITSSTSAPIYVRNAEKVVISLADGSENYVTEGATYVLSDAEGDEPDAAVSSKADLTINGSGSLTVNASYNNGIASKDDLKITGGTIVVFAANDGIKGRDSIAVLDGAVTVTAGGDGLQSNNDEDAEQGFVVVESGELNITAGRDGVQAETSLSISGGEISIIAGGGAVSTDAGAWGGWGMEGNSIKTAESAKGLKAGSSLTITDGKIQIDSLDDAIHSNGSITIGGGDVLLASGDDGIHADATLTINGGDLAITQSYEGLESETITINDGAIHLAASDDGINASSGSGDAGGFAQPVPGGFESGDGYLAINGGTIVVDAYGDGIDVNGSIAMTAGTVIVNGPTNNGNGPLDYLGSFDISGGYLVAVGSAGMAQAPSTTSTQYSAMHNFGSPQAGGTMVHIESESGQEVLTFVPTKEYQSVLLSSPELENGLTYLIYIGGSSTGTAADGLYVEGSYTPGTQASSFAISGMVTGGNAGGMGGFRGGSRRGP